MEWFIDRRANRHTDTNEDADIYENEYFSFVLFSVELLTSRSDRKNLLASRRKKWSM